MFLCQLRQNGNVKKTIDAADIKGVAAFLKGIVTTLEACPDPELVKNLSIGVQELPANNERPEQYQAVVLFSIRDSEAEEEGKPTLVELKDYIDHACQVVLDDEQGNPHGLTKPVVLVDSLMPVAFDLPNVDPMQVCHYFRRRGYVPEALCLHGSEEREFISYPFPTDQGVSIMVRQKGDPTTIYQADITELKVKK